VPAEDELLLEGAMEEELDEELGLMELDEELLGTELLLEEELLEEAEGVEHSLLPPATRPPKVASLQTKLPVSVL
jgi:hypothetical protein